jgi:hypothetical protein
MKPITRRIAFLFALAAFVVGTAAQAGPTAKVIAWKTDFQKALATAGKQGKPIFIDFYSEG